jgi:hypothetical protein
MGLYDQYLAESGTADETGSDQEPETQYARYLRKKKETDTVRSDAAKPAPGSVRSLLQPLPGAQDPEAVAESAPVSSAPWMISGRSSGTAQSRPATRVPAAPRGPVMAPADALNAYDDTPSFEKRLAEARDRDPDAALRDLQRPSPEDEGITPRFANKLVGVANLAYTGVRALGHAVAPLAQGMAEFFPDVGIAGAQAAMGNTQPAKDLIRGTTLRPIEQALELGNAAKNRLFGDVPTDFTQKPAVGGGSYTEGALRNYDVGPLHVRGDLTGPEAVQNAIDVYFAKGLVEHGLSSPANWIDRRAAFRAKADAAYQAPIDRAYNRAQPAIEGKKLWADEEAGNARAADAAQAYGVTPSGRAPIAGAEDPTAMPPEPAKTPEVTPGIDPARVDDPKVLPGETPETIGKGPVGDVGRATGLTSEHLDALGEELRSAVDFGAGRDDGRLNYEAQDLADTFTDHLRTIAPKSLKEVRSAFTEFARDSDADPEHIDVVRDALDHMKPEDIGLPAERSLRNRTGAVGDLSKLEGTPAPNAGEGKTFTERLYSRARKAIDEAPFAKGTGEQWKALLKKGVGQDERTALEPKLEDGKKYTRADVQEIEEGSAVKIGERRFADDTPDRPQHGRWTVPGEKSNYREHVLTFENEGKAFRVDSHFPVDNPLAHVRMSDRALPSGEKALFVEEMQSDVHQKAREVRDEGVAAVMRRDNLSEEEAGKRLDEEHPNYPYSATPGAVGAVPDAPYKKTGEWTELALKKVIDEAVHGKYDRVVIANGEQSAAHYNLSKVADKITYNPENNNLEASNRGDIVHQGTYDPRALEDVIGKDAAARLLATEPTPGARRPSGAAGPMVHTLEGDGLKAGGAGMRGYYDRLVPKVIKDYAKKLGVKLEIEPVDLRKPTGANAMHELTRQDVETVGDDTNNEAVHDVLHRALGMMESDGLSATEALAKISNRQYPGYELSERGIADARVELEQHLKDQVSGSIGQEPAKNISFKVTPELTETVKTKGQPRGFAALPVVAGLAGAGVGSLANKDHPIAGALIGGLAGFTLGHKLMAPDRKSIKDGLAGTINAAGRSDDARVTANTFRVTGGKMARTYEQAHEAMKGFSAAAAKLSAGERLIFINDIETGAPHGTSLKAAGASIIRKMLDTERNKIIALGTGKLQNFIVNYFPHIWADPKSAGKMLERVMGKRPLEGSKNFLKPRTIPTTLEGMFPKGVPAGLEAMSEAAIRKEVMAQGGLMPVTMNPVDLALLKLREMQRYLQAHETLGELKARGIATPLAMGENIPPGFARLNDKVATGYIAPEPAARVFNNYLSPGLAGNALYDAVRGYGNALNAAQLGLSAFHLGFTSMDAAVSRMALGIEQMAAGDGIAAIKSIASTPAAPVTNFLKGRKLKDAYLRPGSMGADMEALSQALEMAGGRVKQDSFYRNSAPEKMIEAWRSGEKGKAASLALPSLFEYAARPIMEHIVPAQKLGVFADLAKHEMSKWTDATPMEERVESMRKVWDSVDNRLGQLVYDNLFWDKTFKDLAMVSTRSVGWNVGTIREIGGGIMDTGKQLNSLRNGGKAELTHRMAYIAALPITVGMAGAVTQYLYTGTGPESIKDYFFPRTGTYDVDGNPNRVQLPSYMKDVNAYASHPWQTIKHKLNPGIGSIAAMLNNEDFYGDKIRNESDPYTKQMLDNVRYLAKETLPLGVRNWQESEKRDATWKEKAAGFVGVTAANRGTTRSPAQNLMNELLPKQGARSPDMKQAQTDRGDILRQMREGKDAGDEINAAVSRGNVTARQLRRIQQRSGTLPMIENFKRLSLEDAMRVYDAGDAREQGLWNSALNAKIARAGRP